ncbi:uncharacterized protein JCM6883_007405 [Sporobolomyces salmoneus]|uniref:uncharacterized protein n=1 Tax=Sporobolomyces salmoneus TaxID=183962 RepID=UPI003175932B
MSDDTVAARTRSLSSVASSSSPSFSSSQAPVHPPSNSQFPQQNLQSTPNTIVSPEVTSSACASPFRNLLENDLTRNPFYPLLCVPSEVDPGPSKPMGSQTSSESSTGSADKRRKLEQFETLGFGGHYCEIQLACFRNVVYAPDLHFELQQRVNGYFATKRHELENHELSEGTKFAFKLFRDEVDRPFNLENECTESSSLRAFGRTGELIHKLVSEVDLALKWPTSPTSRKSTWAGGLRGSRGSIRPDAAFEEYFEDQNGDSAGKRAVAVMEFEGIGATLLKEGLFWKLEEVLTRLDSISERQGV